MTALRGPRAATFPHQHEPAQVRHVRPGKVVERGPLTGTTNTADASTRWRLLSYLDGPLAGRTALFGFLTDAQVPERLPVAVGVRRHHELRDGFWQEVIDDPGQVVHYLLDGDGYRFVGDGAQ